MNAPVAVILAGLLVIVVCAGILLRRHVLQVQRLRKARAEHQRWMRTPLAAEASAKAMLLRARARSRATARAGGGE